jgi:hypothetical protein
LSSLPTKVEHLRVAPTEPIDLQHPSQLRSLSLGGQAFDDLSYDTDAAKCLFALPSKLRVLHLDFRNSYNPVVISLVVAALQKGFTSTRKPLFPHLRWLFFETARSEDEEAAETSLAPQCARRDISFRVGAPAGSWHDWLELADL